jgi:group I intron endonuclease
MVGIYKIKNIVNNKIYVGSTLKSFEFRFKTHVQLLKRNQHENSILQNAWNKYGENNFIFEVVESFDIIALEELLNLEKYYILKYDSTNRNCGYNICAVGKSRHGTKWSEESKKNRCGSGNPMFEKGYLKEGELNPMFGKTLTQTHKDNMSKSLTGLKKPIITELLSKPVLMLDKNNNVVNEYPSYSDATKKTKILHISEACNGQRKTAGGYMWQWK